MTRRTALGADYVVVGAGSAGAVAARRIIDHVGGDVQVLLLEAGGSDEVESIMTPSLMPESLGGPADWGYLTAPQAGAAGRRLSWPRGKVLGGSSSLNGMIWVRGAPADYDHWAYLGNAGWSWSDILPIFIEIESFDAGRSAYHGGDGLQRVTSRYERLPVHESIVEASADVGIPFNPDYNGAALDGISFMQYITAGGLRSNTSQAYLKPIANDPRLEVLTHAHAHRLLIEGSRCTGVEFERTGQLEVADAAREVVVSCGAIGSPQLLMLSGIGPSDELRRLGIEIRAHSPGVGQNLSDHLQVPVIFGVERELDPTLTSQPPAQTHTFWRSRAGLSVPDLQPINYHIPVYGEGQTGPANGITLSGGFIRPFSRGSVRLTAGIATAPMILDPGVLQAQADVEALTVAVELCREIGRMAALRKDWGASELYPGPEVKDRNAVAAYVRERAMPYHHQSGTCKMGIDPMAVVDDRLRVYGVDRLRVADASIMPAVTSGNTHAPAVLIGERVARFIAESAARPD